MCWQRLWCNTVAPGYDYISISVILRYLSTLPHAVTSKVCKFRCTCMCNMQVAPQPGRSSSQGQRESSSHTVPTSSTKNSGTGTGECTICGVIKSSGLLDLSGNEVMQRRLSKNWNMTQDVIQVTLKAICVECVCKLNMHSEVTRSLMQRLQRVSAGTAAKKLPTNAPQLSPPIADEVVPTTLMVAQDKDNAATTVCSSRCTSKSSGSLVLQPYSAQPPESPSATESGGKHNKSNEAENGWKWRTRLVCQHCSRAYFRKDYYKQHMRRCSRQHNELRRSRSRCPVLNEPACDDNEGIAEQLQQKPRLRIYHCSICYERCEGLAALRQHRRVSHMPLKCCVLCNAKFNTKYEWELHYAICKAKDEALRSCDLKSLARSTRSRSRACSVAQQHEDESNDSIEQRNIDDAVSVADTMYTRRMYFTTDWVVNHSRSNSACNMCDDYVQEESHISTDKEYDLYLLDLLKTQVHVKAFSCFAKACCYQTNTLVDLMKHDYVHHWKMSWFYCQKCGDVFTSKVFLDYHLHRQNRGVYICHKCRDEFELQHQLDRHLLLHTKGINYHCNYCRLEFLSEAKLLAHCAHAQHSPNDEPTLICIDHALSIRNDTPETATPPVRQEYATRVLNIPANTWPMSKRPIHMPNHKPFRFSIGICEFVESRNPPNCVGCQ